MTVKKHLLVIGGTSDIGHATAIRYAQAGWGILLAARDPGAARRNADDIETRAGAEVSVHAFDVLETDQFAPFIASLPVLPDTVVCVVGHMGAQQRDQTDLVSATVTLRTNFEAPSLLLALFSDRFQARGSGTIVGVSSVAGDRGRASNYFYGAAKAGFSQFLSGLRNRMALSGNVRVLTVKPGFVRTRMTAGMKLPGLLTVEPGKVASAIYCAAEETRRDVIYVGPIWRLVMMVIRAVPEKIFKRLRL